jgi:hypothetical protein
VIIKGRKQSPPGLIIKGLDNQGRKSLIISDNQAFHHVSPNFSDVVDGSPDQTVDENKATTNRNLAQGKEIDDVRTVTSYFDPVWNSGRLSGHTHVNHTYPDVVRMLRQFHGCPASGGGIERVICSVGKQHDDLKKKTMDKTLEITLKTSINTKLLTCDDKGVFTDDDDTYRKHKYPTVVGTW